MKNNIVILLSTWNGDKYLQEQLDSLNSQTYTNFEIIARDDGSSDHTVDILRFNNNIKIMESEENLGAKRSFAKLLEYALKHSDANYFMFCDQDDVWHHNKIEKTLSQMKKLEKRYPTLPLLIHTDLQVVDEDLNVIHDSMWEYEKIDPSLNTLNRLLMQNTITGCTVMINRNLAEKSTPISNECIMHDWWVGLVATSFGKIAYLNEPSILYRQHANNDTGTKKFDLTLILDKIKKYTQLGPKMNITQAQAFLNAYSQKLDNNTVIMLKKFSQIKEKSFFSKRWIIIKYGLLKYGFIRNIALLLKV